MIDVGKHVAYWRAGAEEDWAVGEELLERRPRHALLMLHLALEKALKAHVCRQTGEIPPKIHNLMRLAEIAALALCDEQREVLAEMNEFQLQGRYPDMWGPTPSKAEAREQRNRAYEVFEWLMNLS